jgi:hypothetical protein
VPAAGETTVAIPDVGEVNVAESVSTDVPPSVAAILNWSVQPVMFWTAPLTSEMVNCKDWSSPTNQPSSRVMGWRAGSTYATPTHGMLPTWVMAPAGFGAVAPCPVDEVPLNFCPPTELMPVTADNPE